MIYLSNIISEVNLESNRNSHKEILINYKNDILEVYMRYRKKGNFWLIMAIVCILITGCKEEEKIRDLDFTVVAKECVPDELLNEITEKKQDKFQMSFRDGNYLYLCVGYGRQNGGGYSICVKDLYLTEKSIVLDTTLLGPNRNKETDIKSDTFPYIVIKMEYIDATVIFS